MYRSVVVHLNPSKHYLPFSSQLCQPFSTSPHPRQRRPVKAFRNLDKDVVCKALGITSYLDWYFLKPNEISDELIRLQYQEASPNALRLTLEEWYPNVIWLPWAFDQGARVSSGFWNNPNTHRAYLDFLGKAIGIKRWQDWYRLEQQDIVRFHGDHLLKGHYNGSISRFIAQSQPEFRFLPWKFNVTPQGYWKDPRNRMLYFDWVSNQLGFTDMNDWYSITAEQISRFAIPSLSAQYNNSFILSLVSTFDPALNPSERSHKFYPWLFRSVPRNYWKNPRNRRLFFDWLFERLNFTAMENWYTVGAPVVIEFGGGGLLHDYYNNVYAAALEDVYPEHKFDRTKFSSRPHGLWQQLDVLKGVIARFEKDLKISHWSDWYRISTKQLRSVGGSYFASSSVLCEALSRVYPDIHWNLALFESKSDKRSAQRWLFVMVKEVVSTLPGSHEVFEESLLPLSKKENSFPTSPIYLDVYVPSLKLAFEYHGEHHYRDTMVFGLTKQYQERDKVKRRVCKDCDITLIEIPYWWRGDKESLIATIFEMRPELKLPRPLNSSPIPKAPPSLPKN